MGGTQETKWCLEDSGWCGAVGPGARGSVGLGEVSLTASHFPLSPQGANILINDAGEVRLGECGGWCWEGGMAGGQGNRAPQVTMSFSLSLDLQLTLVSRPRLGPRWLDASLSLGHPTGEGCLVGSWWCDWGGGWLSPPGSLGISFPAPFPAFIFPCCTFLLFGSLLSFLFA